MNEFNRNLISEFRANGGKVGGPFANAPLVLVTTTGGKSGLRRTTPLVFTSDADRIVIIASKGGAPSHPAWYHNIVAQPEVTVELPNETYDTVASVVADEIERQRLYDAQAALMPNFTEYAAATSRKIPVIVLGRKPS